LNVMLVVRSPFLSNCCLPPGRPTRRRAHVGGAWAASRLVTNCRSIGSGHRLVACCLLLYYSYTVHTVNDRSHRHTVSCTAQTGTRLRSLDCSTVVCPHNLCASAFRMGFADRTATDPTSIRHFSGSVIFLQFAVQKNDDLRFFSLQFRKITIPVTSHLQSFSRVHKALRQLSKGT
jgi:hypothetical protein